jgi:hypothetical protein
MNKGPSFAMAIVGEALFGRQNDDVIITSTKNQENLPSRSVVSNQSDIK